MNPRYPLDHYLSLDYPFQAHPDPDGGYTVVFPDLPGCMTVADDVADIPTLAMDAKRLWLETAYEHNLEIPLPTRPEEYSGKFNLRLPKSLHRRLAEGAARDDVSLNQYAVGLLSEGIAGRAMLAQLRELTAAQHAMRDELAGLATSIEDVRATMETYTMQPPTNARRGRRTSAARPENVVLFGAVAA